MVDTFKTGDLVTPKPGLGFFGKVGVVFGPGIFVDVKYEGDITRVYHFTNLDKLEDAVNVLPKGTRVKVTNPDSNHYGEEAKVIGYYLTSEKVRSDTGFTFGYRVQFDNDEIRQYLPYSLEYVPPKPAKVAKPEPKFKVGDKIRIKAGSKSHQGFINSWAGKEGVVGNVDTSKYSYYEYYLVNGMGVYEDELELVEPEPVSVEYLRVTKKGNLVKKYPTSDYRWHFSHGGFSNENSALAVWSRDIKDGNDKVTEYGRQVGIYLAGSFDKAEVISE